MNTFFSSFKRRRPSDEALECIPIASATTTTTGATRATSPPMAPFSPVPSEGRFAPHTPTGINIPHQDTDTTPTSTRTLISSRDSYSTAELEGTVIGNGSGSGCGVRARAAFFEAMSSGSNENTRNTATTTGSSLGKRSPNASPVVGALSRRVNSIHGDPHTRGDGGLISRCSVRSEQGGLLINDPCAVADALEALQAQLEKVTLEKDAALACLARKSDEVENLRRVVREMSESRSRALAARSDLQERYMEMQAGYQRAMRVNDLSRTVTKENQARISTTQEELRKAQRVLHQIEREAARLDACNQKVIQQNKALKERMNVLEKMDLEQLQVKSACMRVFTDKVNETY